MALLEGLAEAEAANPLPAVKAAAPDGEALPVPVKGMEVVRLALLAVDAEPEAINP